MAIGTLQPNLQHRPLSAWPARFMNTGLLFLVLAGITSLDWLAGGIGHYRHHGVVLAATHLFVLGFGTLVTLGAMIQMVPVLLGRPIENDRAARIAYMHLVPGITLLVGGFWQWVPWLFGLGGFLIVAGVVVFVIPYWKTIRSDRKSPIEAYLLAALVYLLLTVCFGLLMAFQLITPFWSNLTLRGLPLHVILGIDGWFTTIIVGVSYHLFPMFAAAPGDSTAAAQRTFMLLNGGIVVTLLAWLIHLLPGVVLGLALAGSGIFCYAYDVVTILRRRLRRKLGPGVGQAALAIGYLILGFLGGTALAIALWHPTIPLTLSEAQNAIAAIALLLSAGWIGSMILGMLVKISPMILWLNRYAHLTGEATAPSVTDLINENGVAIGAYMYHIGLIALVIALLTTYQTAIVWSAAVWFAGLFIQALVLELVWLKKGGAELADG